MPGAAALSAMLHLALRARRQPAYLRNIGERCGVYSTQPVAAATWIHAVSVGETRAAEPLVDLPGGLDRQHQARHVEQRAIQRVADARVQRRLAPPARRADDQTRGRRLAQHERRRPDREHPSDQHRGLRRRQEPEGPDGGPRGPQGRQGDAERDLARLHDAADVIGLEQHVHDPIVTESIQHHVRGVERRFDFLAAREQIAASLAERGYLVA